MVLLKSRFQGVIHLSAIAEGGLPEVEFTGGEGPEAIMDQVQTYAVPWIKQAIDPAGPSLLWEEIDPEAGELRRHRSLLEGRLEFELCSDEQGVELLLANDLLLANGNGEARPGRAWVPLQPLAEPGRRQRAVLGWNVEKPRFLWRYVSIGNVPTIEITWSCDNFHRSWAEEIRQRFPALKCRLGHKSVCQLSPSREGPLSYQGHFPLPKDSWLPSRWRLGLKVPLVLCSEPGNENGDAASTLHEVDDEVTATVDALDFRAVLGQRVTRLVSLDDLARRFEAEVVTGEETLLPDEIPAGMIPGLPWTVAVERGAPELAIPTPSDGDVRPHPAATRQRRWTLRPQGGDGYWGQVDWEGYPPLLRFGLGSANLEHGPRIARVPERKAAVGWCIETPEEHDELLCFTIPHWIPMGDLGTQLALPYRENGFDYASEVKARIDGLEERFSIDPSSEVPSNRIYLDPRHWRWYDEVSGDTQDAEALGEVDGYVRWRRPPTQPGGHGSLRETEISPTDWAAGSAPVLLARRPEADGAVLDWGGLYVPEPVPWQALEEVRPERTGDDLVLTPRSSLPAFWLSLWGYLCRYDRHPVVFSQTQRPAQRIVTWIARGGLELFPHERGFLLRSFSPLYAVSDSNPRILALEAATPRPVLRLGRELHGPEGPLSIDVGEGTFVRYQLTEPGRLPDDFSPGRIPGKALLLPAEASRQVLWLAVKQLRAEKAATIWEAGYLISWDARDGWRFRGFFSQQDAAVELGMVSLGGEPARVFLGDESRTGRRAFRLTIDAARYAWDDPTPGVIADDVTADMVAEWERRYYARDHLPPPLSPYEVRIIRQPSPDGPWIFEFLEPEHVFDLDPPSGIRIWEPQEGAAEEMLAGVRVLGDDDTQTRDQPGLLGGRGNPTEPPKKVLIAADDDDDDF